MAKITSFGNPENVQFLVECYNLRLSQFADPVTIACFGGEGISATRSRVKAAATIGLSVLIGSADPADADPITAFIFNNTVYEQTSSSVPTTPAFYFFSIGATQTAGDFNSASAAYPGPGSPVSLPFINPTTFKFNSPAITPLTALHAAYPFATYSITTTNTVTSASTTGVINYTADNFTSTVPYLTNYTALNGLNPAAAFTFSLPASAPNLGVTEGFTFFTIYDATTGPLVGTHSPRKDLTCARRVHSPPHQRPQSDLASRSFWSLAAYGWEPGCWSASVTRRPGIRPSSGERGPRRVVFEADPDRETAGAAP
jgi:hypothetical protein